MRVAVVAAVLFLIALFALAQAPTPAAGAQKIAIVNTERVLNESSEGKAAQADLEARFSPREKELQARAQELERLQTDLQQKAATLSETERQRRALDIQQKQKSLQRMNDDVQSDFNAARQDALGRLAKRVNDVITKYGKDHNYYVIFDAAQAGTLYAATSADITTEIVAAYNKQYPAAAPAAPAAAAPKK